MIKSHVLDNQLAQVLKLLNELVALSVELIEIYKAFIKVLSYHS